MPDLDEVNLPGIGPARVRRLKAEGLDTVEKLAAAQGKTVPGIPQTTFDKAVIAAAALLADESHPAAPTPKAAAPAPKPAAPAPKPTEKPAKPTEKPAKKAQKPAKKAEKPAKKAQKPAKKAEKPTKKTKKGATKRELRGQDLAATLAGLGDRVHKARQHAKTASGKAAKGARRQLVKLGSAIDQAAEQVTGGASKKTARRLAAVAQDVADAVRAFRKRAPNKKRAERVAKAARSARKKL